MMVCRSTDVTLLSALPSVLSEDDDEYAGIKDPIVFWRLATARSTAVTIINVIF